MGSQRVLFSLSISICLATITVGDYRSLTSTTADNVWPTDSDLENELEKRVKNVGWSGWSEWSTCSRSCDGGVAQQLRRCHSPSGCRGEPIRYKICNMQACPEVQDFRAHQCSAYDEIPYDGQLYKWLTHYDYAEPCALTCRGRPAHLPAEEGVDETPETQSGLDDEPIVIVQLSNRVQDGTRCRTGSLDMCIQGKCQRVGCDLKIGSAKKVDECGVCGGDGGSCSQPLYHWEIAPMSLCSVTCGGGYKMSRPNCRNRVTGNDVEESLCSAATRPEPAVIQCNTHMCPPKWISEGWSSCSRTCGSGMRERAVICSEESNGIKHKIPDESCRSMKPAATEPCNIQDCPKWMSREWSGCSVSCGTGFQVRKIECVDAFGGMNTNCDVKTKPMATQQCSTGIVCSSVKTEEEPEHIDSEEHEEDSDDLDEDNSEDESDDDASGVGAKVAEYKSDGIVRSQRHGNDFLSSEHMSYADEPIYNQVHHHMTSSFVHHDELPPIAASLTDEQQQHDQIPSEATFVKDSDWTQCSVTCGEGIRRKFYRCKIFLELSRTVATLRNESHCPQPKPAPEVERCTMDPCLMAYGYDETYPRDSIKVGVSEPGKTYVWKEHGYTSCSASCLGGVEELIVNCVREDTDKVVSPFLCSPETKPEARIRTCNDRPCPPRWNYSDYSPCSKSCGIGIREREVQCIHEVTRGGENTMVVPNNMCPQPPPLERQYCNVLDCPVRWEVYDWSKCSKSCGTGHKERRVECKQIMAQEHTVERRPELCPSIKPQTRKPCNTKPCAPEDQRPPIAATNSTYIQHDPKKSKVTLKIGGAATLYMGTQVKIKCPVKRYNRTKIRWSKNQSYLLKSKKFKVSKKGALRILDIAYRDAGVFACHAGLSKAEIKLTVKPKPGDPPPTEEDYKEDTGTHHGRSKSGTNPSSLVDGNIDPNSKKKQQRERNKNNRNRQKNPENIRQSDSNIAENPDEEDLPEVDSPYSAASSSGSRTVKMPHFQHLLASIQSFSNSKGHQMLVDNGMDLQYALEHLESEQPGNVFEFGNTTVLGEGDRENVKFEWKLTEWSNCSQTCGSTVGFKFRKADCMVKLNNASQSVEKQLCEDAGLSVPDTVDKCGFHECPRWTSTEWTSCVSSRCLCRHTAVQKRAIVCKVGNVSVEDKQCDEAERPVSRQECRNTRCTAVWRVEPWSECKATCGGPGMKYRILQCVWYGTKRPAGNACKEQPRPAVMKTCKGLSCISTNNVDCSDTSPYCKNVLSTGLCRLHRYQQKCCKSCRSHIFTE